MEEEWENNAPEEDKATRKTRKKINTLQNENVKFPFKKIPYTPRGSLQWNDDDDNDDDDEVENESVVGHGKGTSPEEDKATRKTRKMINTLQDNTYKFPSEKIPYKPRGSLQLNDDNDNDDDDDEVENESVVGHGKGTSLIAAAEIKNFLENRLPTLTAGVSMQSIMMFHIDSGFNYKLTRRTFPHLPGHPEPCGADSQYEEFLRLSRSCDEWQC